MGICLGTDDVGKSSNRKKGKYSIVSANENAVGTYMMSVVEHPDEVQSFDFLNTIDPLLYDTAFIRDQLGTYINKHIAAHQKLYNRMDLFNSKAQSFIDNTIKKNQKKFQSNINRDHPFFKEFKYSIRLSTPLKIYKDIMTKIFNQNLNNLEGKYNIIKNTLFEFTNPDQIIQCPQFSNEKQYSTLEDNMSLILLNADGIVALKRILWILKECDPSIQFNPIIKYTIQFLLCFFAEYEVYFMIRSLLDESLNILNSDMIVDKLATKLKFHFLFDMASFDQFCIQFTNRLIASNKRMKLMEDYLQYNLKISLSQVFSNLMEKAFYPALPLIAHFQMMLLFIKEGLRIFHNVGYALLDHHYKQILESKSIEELELILAATPVDLITSSKKLQQFFKFGFKNKLKKGNTYKLKPQSKKTIQPRFCLYYRPKLREHSYILQYKHFEIIWSWLPHHQKLQNPVQIYSTQIDGYSLQQIYLKAKEFKNMGMLLIIKTHNNIFGAYCDRMLNLKENKVYYGSNECFVFQIEPKLQPYYSTQLNENHIFVDHQSFSIGSDSPAIQINSDLQGKTFKSETYNNQPLNDADPDDYNACSFDVLELEIYTLHFL